MQKGKTFPQSLKAAMINAESVIANYGAKNILLDEKALEKRLEQDKRKVTATAKKTKKASKKTPKKKAGSKKR
jgi:hypothetical protein